MFRSVFYHYFTDSIVEGILLSVTKLLFQVYSLSTLPVGSFLRE